jgi:hypothetical protein
MRYFQLKLSVIVPAHLLSALTTFHSQHVFTAWLLFASLY